MPSRPSRSPREITAEILAGLNIVEEFKLLGVEIVGQPRSSGMVSCRAIGREDRKPSAWVNIKSAMYGDSGSKEIAASTCSLFDLAVRQGKYLDWKAARKAYAAKAGIELGRSSTTHSKDDWRNRLILQPWSTTGNDILAMRWCSLHKKGCTLESIKAAGGTLAYYPCHWDKETKQVEKNHDCRQVIAIPCYGEYLLDAEPVAWILYDITGQPFKVKDAAPADYPKTVSCGPTRGTIVGLSALMILLDPDRRAQLDLCWRVEGAPDMLALWAAIPAEQRDRHIVITNGGGASADVLPHQAKLLAGLNVAVCGDCDEAGAVGQAKWLRALEGLTTESREVVLPWPTQKSHGNDVRDYLNGLPLPGETPLESPAAGGRGYNNILALAESAKLWNPAVAPATPEEKPTPAAAVTKEELDQFEEQKIIKALRADVLGISEDGRTIKVYSEFHRRVSYLQDPAKLKYENLLTAFGTPVKSVVSRNNEDNAPGMYPIREVREALSFLAGYRLLSDDTELGSGIWPCKEPEAASPNGKPCSDLSAIVLVNQSEAAHYNGKFEKVLHPRHGGNLLAFDTGAKPWYDFKHLAGLLKQADDSAWRYQVVDDLYCLFHRWHWRGQNDHMILAGLVLSTWVQSLWAWRPRVDILGASNTGKSMFCYALAGIFDKLCLMTSDTTAAGMRQEISNRMLAVVVDEVDAQSEVKVKEQRKILEMIRSASRGTVSIRGTGHQKSVKFTLRHIVWVAGITLSYDSQADRNRAIALHLLPPEPAMAGKLVLPPADELADLGQKSLAVALWCAREACKIAVALKDAKIDGVDARQVESYAVPAAILWLAMGLAGTPRDVLIQMLESAKTETGGMETDEESLIAAILRAQVRAQIPVSDKGSKMEVLSIGQAIEQSLNMENLYDVRKEWKKVLGQAGVAFGTFGYSSTIPQGEANQEALILNYQTIKTIPLKGSRWYDQPIDQVLRRLPGARLAQRRVGGSKGRVVMLPLKQFIDRYIGQEDGTQEAAF